VGRQRRPRQQASDSGAVGGEQLRADAADREQVGPPRVSSPLIARPPRSGRLVKAETRAAAIVTLAEAPW